MIEWRQVTLDTFISDLPKLIRDNQAATQRYVDLFYDPSKGVVIAPVKTTGKVQGAQANFVTGVFDNLVVRNQYTNLYQNITTIDTDFYNTYVGADASTRVADPSVWENTKYAYIDVNQPYYKITNDVSIAFKTSQLGQEFQIIFDTSVVAVKPYVVLLDPSTDSGKSEVMYVTNADASGTWVKLIAVEYDASWGTKWILKQHGGSFTRSEI